MSFVASVSLPFMIVAQILGGFTRILGVKSVPFLLTGKSASQPSTERPAPGAGYRIGPSAGKTSALQPVETAEVR
jgi:hypothetical protein